MDSQVLALGEALLAALRQPVSDEMLERVDALLEQRAVALAGLDPALLAGLQEQQAQLEQAMQQVLTGLGAALRESRSRGAQVQGVQRMMRAGTQSRLLSEKR